MRRIILISVLGLVSIFLISCTTIKKPGIEVQKEEWEYGKLVFMETECVAWFSPDLNIIGPKDLEEYFQKNNIEPSENKILAHFTSLGWELVEKTQQDKYTTEYKLKRKNIASSISD